MDEGPRAELLGRLNSRVVGFAVATVCALLAVADVRVWRMLERNHRAALEAVHEQAASEIERRLAAGVALLEAMGHLPGVESVLVPAEPSSPASERRAAAGTIAQEWAGYGRDEAVVREVVSNPFAELLRRVCRNQPQVRRLILTDAKGLVRAASEKTAIYDFSDEAWWKDTVMQGGRAVSDGLADGLIGLAVPLLSHRGPGILQGVLRAELKLEDLAAGLVAAGDLEDGAVLLIGRGIWKTAGSQAVFERVSPGLASRFTSGSRVRGWRQGLRFTSRCVDANIAWSSPVWITAIRSEGPAPLDLYSPIAALAFINILVAMLCIKATRWYVRRSITPAHVELLEAGDWILRTALGRRSELTSEAGVGKPKNIIPQASRLQRELQKWLRDLLQNLQDDRVSQTDEMQRDLDLARDFQRTYIDRVYPKIPATHVEGRLRLDFYHHYEPALALGGDFYNILTLGPDCGGVFIADVMGHGTRSALITAIIRTLIDDLAPQQGRDARRFLGEMNKQFCSMLKSVPYPLFASAFYLVADTTAQVGTYSAAGHPPPFLLRRSTGRIVRLEAAMPRGAALGLIPREVFTGGLCRLLDGDVFLFVTDGAYEAYNSYREEFGIGRMTEVIQSLMYKSTKEIVDGLFDAITGFVGYEPISDDICLVAMEVTTRPAE